MEIIISLLAIFIVAKTMSIIIEKSLNNKES